MAVNLRTLENTVNVNEVEKFEAAFDAKLVESSQDEGGIRSNTFGDLDREKPGYRRLMVVIGGTMSPSTKTELRSRYEAAGWEVRRIGNSGDNGDERPGLAYIEFWIKD